MTYITHLFFVYHLVNLAKHIILYHDPVPDSYLLHCV